MLQPLEFPQYHWYWLCYPHIIRRFGLSIKTMSRVPLEHKIRIKKFVKKNQILNMSKLIIEIRNVLWIDSGHLTLRILKYTYVWRLKSRFQMSNFVKILTLTAEQKNENLIVTKVTNPQIFIRWRKNSLRIYCSRIFCWIFLSFHHKNLK